MKFTLWEIEENIIHDEMSEIKTEYIIAAKIQ